MAGSASDVGVDADHPHGQISSGSHGRPWKNPAAGIGRGSENRGYGPGRERDAPDRAIHGKWARHENRSWGPMATVRVSFAAALLSGAVVFTPDLGAQQSATV